MRVLSGIQPSGRLHLGNYFGAMRPQIEMQAKHECFYFIANYHALTSLTDAAMTVEYTRQVAMGYLALGLDPATVNPMGGAIALGHPLGATGAIRAATVVHALKRHKLKYGMVTMCVGTGQGAAGIFEAV